MTLDCSVSYQVTVLIVSLVDERGSKLGVLSKRGLKNDDWRSLALVSTAKC